MSELRTGGLGVPSSNLGAPTNKKWGFLKNYFSEIPLGGGDASDLSDRGKQAM
jgi:hypothetical protein